MMKILIFLLLPVLIQAHCHHGHCHHRHCHGSCLENLIDKKVKEGINSAVSSALEKVRLHCITEFAKDRYATCPAGYKVTGCSCGMACGSWDIRNEATCHCQCLIMDWSSARCCKTG